MNQDWVEEASRDELGVNSPSGATRTTGRYDGAAMQHGFLAACRAPMFHERSMEFQSQDNQRKDNRVAEPNGRLAQPVRARL